MFYSNISDVEFDMIYDMAGGRSAFRVTCADNYYIPYSRITDARRTGGSSDYLPYLVRMAHDKAAIFRQIPVETMEGELLVRFINALGGPSVVGGLLHMRPLQGWGTIHKPPIAKLRRLQEILDDRVKKIDNWYLQVPKNHTATKGLKREVTQAEAVAMIKLLGTAHVCALTGRKPQTVNSWSLGVNQKSVRQILPLVKQMIRDEVLDILEQAINIPFPCDESFDPVDHFRLTGVTRKDFALRCDMSHKTFGARLSGHLPQMYPKKVCRNIPLIIREQYNQMVKEQTA